MKSYQDNAYSFALATAFVMILGLFVYRIFLVFSYNGEIGGIDNNFVYGVISNMTGHGLYNNPEALPYPVTIYSPLYFQVCSAIGTVLHVNPDDPIQVYQLCRMISLILDIGTCLSLYFILKRRFNVSTQISWLATASFACILCTLGYTFSRCDSLLLLFYALTMYQLTRSADKKITSSLVLAILSIGCILSKQNGIIVPVLICAGLFFLRLKKNILYYLLFFVPLFAGLLFLYHSQYPYFFVNTVKGLNNRIDLSWFYTDIFKRMINAWWSIPLYPATVLAFSQWIKPRSAADKAFATIFIIQTAFSLGTSLKWGSTAGYFNESFFLAFIIIGRKVMNWKQEPYISYSRKAISWLLPLLLIFFIHTIAEGYLFFIQDRSEKETAYLQQKGISEYLRPKLQGHYVLNLGSANGDFFKTILYKEMAVPNMDIVDCCTLPDHTFNYSSLERDITNGTIAYIISRDKLLPPEIWGISLHSFSMIADINGYVIYSSR
ncbi:MAG: glycosyltransferase family 39 protein [Chitinophagaceae bacterium]